MHVTMYRVKSQDICPSPNTMPKSYIRKYRQPFLRSLPEGKGGVLKQL